MEVERVIIYQREEHNSEVYIIHKSRDIKVGYKIIGS